jgi:hypothetical protein
MRSTRGKQQEGPGTTENAVVECGSANVLSRVKLSTSPGIEATNPVTPRQMLTPRLPLSACCDLPCARDRWRIREARHQALVHRERIERIGKLRGR